MKRTERIDTFQSELERKCDVIKSMEMVHNTFCELIEDKGEMIQSKKQIIKHPKMILTLIRTSQD